MPYQNEHAARIHDPGQYDRIRRENDKFGPGIDVIWGVKGSKTEVQAIRFDAKKFTAAEARAWLKDHDYKPIEFEKATGPVAKNVRVAFSANEYLPLRMEKLDGRDYLVAPVVMVAVGIMNGFLYPADELAKAPESWNGREVPVYHPEDGRGEFLSANSPEVIAARTVGRVFNAVYDAAAGKLRGEVWIDVEKADRVDKRILPLIRGGGRLEVSTALWCDEDMTPGEWKGKPYKGIARNHRPDHLALLPDVEGACSWEDGCGIRANAAKEVEMTGEEWKAWFMRAARKLANKKAVSHGEIRDQLQKQVSAMDGGGWAHYVDEVFDGWFVYEACKTPTEQPPGPMVAGGPAVEKLFRQSFSLDAKTGEVTLTADAAEVREKTSYVPITGNEKQEPETPTGVNERRGGNEAKPQEEITMAKKEMIDRLIACDCTRFAENDRAFLEGLEDAQLERLAPPDGVGVLPVVDPKAKAGDGDPPAKGDPAQKVEAEAPKPVTFEALMAAAPAEVKGPIERLLARDKAEKETLVDELIKNSRCTFKKDELSGRPIEELEKIAALANVQVDYSGQGGAVPKENERQEDGSGVPEPPPLFEAKKV